MAHLDTIPLNSYKLDDSFSGYGNVLGFKQTYTNEHGTMHIQNDDFLPILEQSILLLIICSNRNTVWGNIVLMEEYCLGVVVQGNCIGGYYPGRRYIWEGSVHGDIVLSSFNVLFQIENVLDNLEHCLYSRTTRTQR